MITVMFSCKKDRGENKSIKYSVECLSCAASITGMDTTSLIPKVKIVTGKWDTTVVENTYKQTYLRVMITNSNPIQDVKASIVTGNGKKAEMNETLRINSQANSAYKKTLHLAL